MDSVADSEVTFTVTWERTREAGPVLIKTKMSTSLRTDYTSTVANVIVSTLDTGFTCRAVANIADFTTSEGRDSKVVMVTGNNYSYMLYLLS